jgi:ribosomal-protein-alanine N-acetyltransferase
MSAVPKETPRWAAMRESDLAEVVAIEDSAYTHPWSKGNFADSLHSGYICRTLRENGALIGYFVVLVAAEEAHLLNLTVAPSRHRRGYGRALLGEAMALARERGARSLFLEVRPSNLAAQALYERLGFRRIAVRRGYYPAREGREDALVLVLDL